MTIYIELDFETRSLRDLKKSGAWAYAEDFSTDVICLVYQYPEGGGSCWTPRMETDGELYDLAADPDVIFVAHNAMFEQAIWACIMVPQYGFPEIPVDRWECTLASCAWKGYPLALDRAGRALKLPMDKDKDGNALTLEMSGLGKAKRVYKKTGILPELTPAIRQRIIRYCQQDVVVEHGVLERVGLISRQNKNERKVWTLDQTINRRGVALDLEYVEAAQVVVDRASVPLHARFTALTGLTKVGSPRLLEWSAASGLHLENLQKKTLQGLLEIEEDDNDPAHGYESLAGDELDCWREIQSGIPANVREALDIRIQLGGAAVKKLPAMAACVCYDGRARGLLQYHAAHSGRFGGRLLQPQNFPRESVKGLSPDDVVTAILSRDPGVVERATGLPALDAVARSLRHALVASPGKVFLVGDYKSIEAVIILCLAGHYDLAEKLAAGAPVYMEMAEQIYNQPKGTWTPTDAKAYKHLKEIERVQEYTIGKNTILGCGFQMGPTKFHARYCPEQRIEFAERVVESYRKEFAPGVPKVWYGLQEAALDAMNTCRSQEWGPVRYEPVNGWMKCHLPGWQKLWYPQPSLCEGKFGDPAWRYMKAKNGQWVPVDMYGGLEAENVVQAIARGILVGAMMRLEEAGFPVVLSVHDEIICEVDEDKADLVQFADLMTERAPWVEALRIPVAVETWSGTRYKK